MEQQTNASRMNNFNKRLHIQKPNNRVVFSIFALIGVALIFIFLYIFVLQGDERIHAVPSYNEVVATQDDYNFVYLGKGAETFIAPLEKGTHVCSLSVQGLVNADELLQEPYSATRDRAHINNVLARNKSFGDTQRSVLSSSSNWDMRDYNGSFLVNTTGNKEELELEVRAQAVNNATDVNWAVACKSVESQGAKTSLAKRGVGPQIITTDLAPGDYECRFDLPDSVTQNADYYNSYYGTLVNLLDYQSVVDFPTPKSVLEPGPDIQQGDERPTFFSFNPTFWLRVTDANQPPLLQFADPHTSTNWRISWSLSCSPYKFQEQDNPVASVPDISVGTQVFEYSGVGEEQVEFNQAKGFYVCALNIPQIPTANLVLGGVAYYPDVKLNVIYQNSFPERENGVIDKVEKVQWSGSTNIQQSFFIRNGVLNNTVSALELDISSPYKTIESFDWNENVRWYVACNAVEQQKQQTTLTAQGVGSTYIPTNLQTGDYACRFNIRNNEFPQGAYSETAANAVWVNVYPFTPDTYDSNYALDYWSHKFSSVGASYPGDSAGSYEFGFSVNAEDEPPLMYVSAAQKIAEWDVQCNQLDPNNRVTAFTQTGSSPVSFISNVSAGTHQCFVESEFLPYILVYVNGEVVPSLYNEEGGRLVSVESGQTSADFQIVNTSASSSPEVSVQISGFGRGEWNIQCGV